MFTEKQLEETIRLNDGKLVKYSGQVLMQLWGTSGQGTMDKAKVFCKQNGFAEPVYDQGHNTIKFRAHL